MENRKPLIWQLAVFLAVEFAILEGTGFILKGLRLPSLVLTLIAEIFMLAAAVLYVKLTKGDLKDAFRFEKPTGRKLIGSLIIYGGAYLFMLTVTLFIAYLFPEQYFATADNLAIAFTSGLSPLAAFLIITVTPAICEEAVFRGASVYSLRGLKKWIVIVSTAVVFALFHESFIRFFPTVILGMTFALVYLESGNMIYSMILHFINNAISTVAIFFIGTEELMAEAAASSFIPLISVGVYFMLCAAVPFIINAGLKMYRPKEIKTYTRAAYGQRKKDDPLKRKLRLIAFAMALIGLAMIVTDYNSRDNTMIMEGSVSAASSDVETVTAEFEIKNGSLYNFAYSVKASRGIHVMKVWDISGDSPEEIGELIFTDKAEGLTSFMLQAGKYRITVESHVDDVWEFSDANGLGYTKEADLIVLGMNADPAEEVEIEYRFTIE